MNQRISILGCGWLGFALAKDLLDKGYEVYGSTTSASKIPELQKNGIRPFKIDICNSGFDLSDFLTCEVLIIAITSKNLDDIKTLIKQIEEFKVQKVIFISSTSVYPNTNGIVTEETKTAKTPLAAIEKLFTTKSTFKTTIVRFGGLFGYNRQPSNFIKPNKPVNNPEGYINFIHRDDCVEVIEQIILKNVWNETLNACADDHPTRREFYLNETKKIGLSSIVFNGNSRSEYKIISSEKLKRLLDYSFKHADLM